jgi:pyruvate dehydrogenase E2 component (dihydrolipoamide acetyltransferase)
MIDMKLPELGENVESGDVLRVLVKAGDRITKDQPVLELETDKATIEVPSSAEGVVKDIKVKAGEKVKVGQTIFVVEDGGAPATNAPEAAPKAAASAGQAPAAAMQAAAPVGQAPAAAPAPAPKNESAASGTGPALNNEAEAPKPPVSEPPRASAPQGPVAVPSRVAEPKRPAQVVEMTRPKAPAAAADASAIPAAPSARRLARELGVNLSDVRGSGPGGRIAMDDVTAYARRVLAGAGGGGAPVLAAAPLPDFSAWGTVERKPMTGVRRTTARRLTQAWNTVPHVVQHDRADITSVDALRKRLSKKAEADGRAPVTITAFLMKTLAAALKKFPQVNSSVDLQSEEIIYKQYVNVGVAVDTDRGLLVPVVRDVDEKDIFQLADEIAQAAEKARSRKLSLDDMQGGTFTISNLGGLGGGAFSPIVNWPEVAILGVARAKMEPVWSDGQFVPRLMIPLSLSYDHRVVDGADGVRFLRWIVEALEQPALIWLDV